MATRTSTSNGAWNSAGTWDTGIPVDGDTAVIDHNVYIDSDVTVGTNANGETVYAITINSGGVLRWANPPSGDWTLTLHGGVYVKQGGTFQIGTQASRIPAARKATVHFDSASASNYWRIFVERGVFDAHGAEAYHMGSTSMQRAKLVGNIAAGSDIAFELDRAVDWEVDDWVAFGCGSDVTFTPSPTTHRPEKVQIKTKTDSTHYTADFTYLHRGGDHVASLERNVIFKGNGANSLGCRIYGSNGTASGTTELKLRVTWAKLLYPGFSNSASYAGILFGAGPNIPTELIQSDAFLAQSVVFEESGGTLTGSFPSEYIQGYAMRIGAYTTFEKRDCVTDIVMYMGGRGVSFGGDSPGALDFERWTSIGNSYATVDAQGGRDISIYDMWACGRNWSQANCELLNGGFNAIENLEAFHVYRVLDSMFGSGYSTRAALIRFLNWQVRWSYFMAVTTVTVHQTVLMDACDFFGCRYSALETSHGFSGVIRNSSFDKCGFGGVSSDRAINLSAAVGDVFFENCMFGTSVPNRLYNIRYEGAVDNGSTGRIRAEKCTFVEPDAATTTYTYYNKTWLWSLFPASSDDWRYRVRLFGSIELADCTVLDQSLVDQGAIDYPGCSHMVMCAGGGEMIDEATVVLDGKFARKITPLHTVVPMNANIHNPIQIPVAPGDVVTVKLSLRKTKDGQIAIPGIRLEGPGILDEAYTTRGVLDTWEELTVSGTAELYGMCYLYVLAGTNNCYGISSNHSDPVFGPPQTSGDWRNMFDCTVYTDGLSISIA